MPSAAPSDKSSDYHSGMPSAANSDMPSAVLSNMPPVAPSAADSSAIPTDMLSMVPSAESSALPSYMYSEAPSIMPSTSPAPSSSPSVSPSAAPSIAPSLSPTFGGLQYIVEVELVSEISLDLTTSFPSLLDEVFEDGIRDALVGFGNGIDVTVQMINGNSLRRRRLQTVVPVEFSVQSTKECYISDCNEFATNLIET